MKNIKYQRFIIVFTWLASCTPKADIPAVSKGTADLSKFVSIGNSLTSGYADNALYKSGQEHSFPNVMATQFALVGGGSFTQPLMPDDIGGFANLGIAGKLQLQTVNGSLSPVATTAVSAYASIATDGPYNNVGVPGVKSYHILSTSLGDPAGIALGTANPYYARFATSASTSILQYAAAQNPTFFSLWLGNNDVLLYATNGAAGTDQTGNTNPATYASNDLSDPNVVANVLQSAVTTLTANGAKGVIANIPTVTDIPYFTTVPYNALSPGNTSYTAMIPTLNQSFASLNAVFDYLQHTERKVSFSATDSTPLLIRDESLADLSAQITSVLTAQGIPAATAALYGNTYGLSRQATAADLILLTASSVIGKVDATRFAQLKAAGLDSASAAQLSIIGITYPMEDKYTLTPDEQTHVNTAVEAYNNNIKSIATSNGLAFVDVNAFLKKVKNSGVEVNGRKITTTFVTGGAFSLDGVHLTKLGYLLVANEFIKAINSTYNANIPLADPSQVGGVLFP